MGPIGHKWYEEDGYLKRNPDWGVSDSPWKAGLVQAMISKNCLNPSKITEVGCGYGVVLDELAKVKPDSLFEGYDISPDAIKVARSGSHQKNVRFHHADLAAENGYQTDLLLVLDVVEHVEDYLGFLFNLKSKAKNHIFHIPLDLSVRTLLKPHVLLEQREKNGHLHYFNIDMVWWMLRDTGFEVIDWMYTKPVTDRITSPGIKQKFKKSLRNLSFSMHKDLSASLWGNYSIIILTR